MDIGGLSNVNSVGHQDFSNGLHREIAGASLAFVQYREQQALNANAP